MISSYFGSVDIGHETQHLSAAETAADMSNFAFQLAGNASHRGKVRDTCHRHLCGISQVQHPWGMCSAFVLDIFGSKNSGKLI
jgi:hypothetical protein